MTPLADVAQSTAAGIITASASVFTAIALLVSAVAVLIKARSYTKKVDKKVDHITDTTEVIHGIVNSQRTAMLELINRLEHQLRDVGEEPQE